MKIIAEIANVHEGSEQYLLDLVEEIVNAGLLDIKFQYIVPSEFGIKGSASYKEFDRLSISYEFYANLVTNQLKNCNIYFDIFGDQSFDKVLQLNELNKIKGVKIHTTNSLDFDLIEKSIKVFNEVFISISGLTNSEILQIINYLTHKGFLNKVVLFYGVQTYPTSLESIKLNKMVDIGKTFNVNIGLSEHLDGDDKLSKNIVNYAWLLGYSYIEKHVTLNRSRRLDDDHAALEVNELSNVINGLKKILPLFSDNVLKLDKNEKIYRNSAKKILVAKKNIKLGHLISRDDIRSVRQDDIKIDNYINWNDLVGKTAAGPIPLGLKFTRNDVEQNLYALIIVRSQSTRFSRKCYSMIGENESIRILIKRIKKSRKVKKIILCTTNNKADDRLEEIAKEEDIQFVRGSANVENRISLAFKIHQIPDFFVRLTGDNIFIDTQHLDNALEKVINEDSEYYKHDSVIDGCDFEIIKHDAYLTLPYYYDNFEENSEYMTLFLNNNYFRKSSAFVYKDFQNYKNYRLTFDYDGDYVNLKTLYEFTQDIYMSYKQIYTTLEENNLYKRFLHEDKSTNITPTKRVTF